MKQDLIKTVIEKYSLPEEIAALNHKVPEGLADYEERLLRPFIKAGGRTILDIGCGPAREAIPLMELGHSVVGIDISAGMLREARRNICRTRHPMRLALMNATELGFVDQGFDLALMFSQILACIPGRDRRVRALEEARRVLRPGGYLLFSTHSRNANPVKARKWKIVNAARHLARTLSPGYRLEEGDSFVAHVSGRTLTPQKMFIHIYTRDEAVEDIGRAGLEFMDCFADHELASGRLDAARRENARYLFFIARRRR